MKRKQPKSYFTAELQERINKMTDNEMRALLLDLEGTSFWVAVLKYVQDRQTYAQDGLKTTDPFKETGKVCQLQGVMLGLSDLVNAVISIKEESLRNLIPETKESSSVEEEEDEEIEDLR